MNDAADTGFHPRNTHGRTAEPEPEWGGARLETIDRSDLKPCPGCGAANLGLRKWMSGDARRWVRCFNCHHTGPVTCDDAGARQKWNALPRAHTGEAGLRSELAKLEWCARTVRDNGFSADCPSCGAAHPGPHHEGCTLYDVLVTPPTGEAEGGSAGALREVVDRECRRLENWTDCSHAVSSQRAKQVLDNLRAALSTPAGQEGGGAEPWEDHVAKTWRNLGRHGEPSADFEAGLACATDPAAPTKEGAAPDGEGEDTSGDYVLGYRNGTSDAVLRARAAKLPENFQWGRDATESFDFGKERAALAIEAYAHPPAATARSEVWVVTGTVGEWSDRSEWSVCAYVGVSAEADAKAFAEHLGQQTRALKPSDVNDYDARDAWEEAMRAIEPSFSTYCGDEPSYTAGLVEIGRAVPRQALAQADGGGA